MDSELLIALKDSLIMVTIPMLLALIFSPIIASILFLSHKDGLKPNKFLYHSINLIVNVVRSFPYLIFVILLIPLTRLVVGTAFGVYAATFPMCFIAICLYARFIEQSFYEVNYGIIELAKSLNASTFRIIVSFLMVESRQSLVLGFTSCFISMISYSTVMGIVGGGGIGDYALQHGFYSFDYIITFKCVVILAALVFLIQFLGNWLANILDKKRRDF